MYRISELAKTHSVSAHTLRYYEKYGLLRASARSDSGYRLYSEEDNKQLRFILMARQSGFSLDDIQTLLSIELDKGSHTCEEVTRLTRSKLDEVSQRIHELKQVKKSLETLLASCGGGEESAVHCTILQSLEDGEKTQRGKN